MTDEQFQALAPYEDLFARVVANAPRMNDYPGRAALQTMVAVIRSARPRYQTNLNCRTCVNNTIRVAAAMYFTAKDERAKAEPKPDKAKKQTRKKDAVATPEN